MPATVIVNNMTVVHKSSSGMTQIFPDVCKTPAPPAPVPPPLPYPNVAMSSDTAQGSSSVTCDGNPVMIKSSNFRMSTGDEAGVALGVASSKIKGKAEPKLFSMDVKFDGENVMRLTDIMLQNIGSSPNTPPGTEVQPPALALASAAPKDPELPEVTRMRWNKTPIVCGDKLKISVKTKLVPSGSSLPVRVPRKQKSKNQALVHDSLLVPISGDSGSFEWTSRQLTWAKEIDIVGEQKLYKGVQKSNEVKMKTVPEVALVKQTIVPTPDTTRFIVWNAGFEAEIKKGVFRVVRKIHFKPGSYNPGPAGSAPSRKLKKQWKREIEGIWNNKWKLHRTKCKRGDTCDCHGDNGCCTFNIHVVAVWSAGPFSPVGFNRGPNAANAFVQQINVGGLVANPHYMWWWFSHDWWEGRQNLGNPGAVVAHEFGHLLGLHDEYPQGAVLIDPVKHIPLYANVPTSIMGSGTRTFARHVKAFKTWFDAKAGSVIGKTKLIRK